MTDVERLRAVIEALLRAGKQFPKWAEDDARRVLAETAPRK